MEGELSLEDLLLEEGLYLEFVEMLDLLHLGLAFWGLGCFLGLELRGL